MVTLPNGGSKGCTGRRVGLLLLACAWLALSAWPSAAQAPTADPAKPDAERRIALVIGNGAYKGGAALANPVNDARAVGAKLKALGFEVISVENGTLQQMLHALGSFSNKLGPDAVSLFYYAGHGMQVNGHNYLLPVDAQISTEQTVRLETVDVDAVIDQMAMAKSRVNLLILDACRNNPYERRFRSQSGGLASIEAPTGTMIAYATSPGKVAADGEGANGLYTSELLAAMDIPGAKVEEVFKRVRARVTEKSRGEQTPWESTSLTGDFYFNGPTTVILSPAPAGTPADRDVVFWTSVKDSGDPALLQAYLDQFPHGTFAGAAKVMIEKLKHAQKAALQPKPEAPPASVAPAPSQQALALPPAAAVRPPAPADDMRAAPGRPGWSVDQRSGCWVWVVNSGPSGRTVTWSGGCGADGRAAGRGVEAWTDGERYEGEMRDGKRNGHGVLVFISGNRYEGEWRDGRPDGFGEYWRNDGTQYRGNWAGGCFREANRRVAITRLVSECP